MWRSPAATAARMKATFSAVWARRFVPRPMVRIACGCIEDEAAASGTGAARGVGSLLMSLRSRLFAAMYDRMSARAEEAGLRDMRRGLLAQAEGRVLEIGAGTGANLALYGPGVSTLTLTEPERPMLRRLEQRALRDAPEATVLRAPAED